MNAIYSGHVILAAIASLYVTMSIRRSGGWSVCDQRVSKLQGVSKKSTDFAFLNVSGSYAPNVEILDIIQQPIL